MTAPETLLAAAIGGPDADSLVQSVPMLVTPYDALSSIAGWVVGADDDTPTTAPFVRGMESADARVLAALSVALDYAVRRGAGSLPAARQVLSRESPIWIPGHLAHVSERLHRAVLDLGLNGDTEPPAFARRRTGHATTLGRRHDPALSFQHRSADEWIGGVGRSSLDVRSRPVTDSYSAEGSVECDQWHITVGIGEATLSSDELETVRAQITCMPSFLDGVSAQTDEDVLTAGWRHGQAPTGEQLAGVLYAWTKALFDLAQVEVHVRFVRR